MNDRAKTMRNCLPKFAASMRGTAAIEFAFIVPVLALIVLSLADIATIAIGMGEMQTASRAAIQYAIAGGADMAVAQTQGLKAWNSEPADGALTAVSACLCGATATDCQVLCADGSFPNEYVTVTASGTLGGHMISKSETLTEVVRVR
jgi:Flp pilus assembly protein TadG